MTTSRSGSTSTTSKLSTSERRARARARRAERQALDHGRTRRPGPRGCRVLSPPPVARRPPIEVCAPMPRVPARAGRERESGRLGQSKPSPERPPRRPRPRRTKPRPPTPRPPPRPRLGRPESMACLMRGDEVVERVGPALRDGHNMMGVGRPAASAPIAPPPVPCDGGGAELTPLPRRRPRRELVRDAPPSTHGEVRAPGLGARARAHRASTSTTTTTGTTTSTTPSAKRRASRLTPRACGRARGKR